MYLDTSRTLKEIKYDRMTASGLAFGALAFGTKNGRTYLQILWVPVPLWSLK